MFKNLKNELIDNKQIEEKTAKSYYIENLLYNVPDNLFSGTYTERFSNILEELIKDFNSGSTNNYYCANKVNKLISDTTWRSDLLKQFLIGLIVVRDKTSY
jgi:hypothetical protein